MVSLARRNRLIRIYGGRQAAPNPNSRRKVDPNPNPCQIRLTRMDRLTIATWRPGMTRLIRQTTTSSIDTLTRIPSDTILGTLTSISDGTWAAGLHTHTS